MNVFMWFILVPLVAGIGIALYEWRKKTVLLKHDMSQIHTTQTEADRELERSTAAMRDRFMFDHFS